MDFIKENTIDAFTENTNELINFSILVELEELQNIRNRLEFEEKKEEV